MTDMFDFLQEAYDQGSDAYYAGLPRASNPRISDEMRESWFAGYDRAKELDDE